MDASMGPLVPAGCLADTCRGLWSDATELSVSPEAVCLTGSTLQITVSVCLHRTLL